MIGGGNPGFPGKPPGQPAPGCAPDSLDLCRQRNCLPTPCLARLASRCQGRAKSPGARTEQKPRPGLPGAVKNPPGTPSPNKDHALPSGQQLPPLQGKKSSPGGAKPVRTPSPEALPPAGQQPTAKPPARQLPSNHRHGSGPNGKTAAPGQVLPLLRNRKVRAASAAKSTAASTAAGRSAAAPATAAVAPAAAGNSRAGRSRSSGTSRSRPISRRARSNNNSGTSRSRPISSHAAQQQQQQRGCGQPGLPPCH